MKNNQNILLKLILLIILASIISFSKIIDIDKYNKNSILDNKDLILFFTINYCPYCAKMKNYIFKDKSIKKIISKYFTVVHIIINDNDTIVYENKSYNMNDFKSKMKTYIYPTQIFMHRNKIIQTIHGYRNKDKLETLLKYIYTDAYIKFSLQEFIDELAFKSL